MEAITRKEKIMSGENLTPITRKEMFLAKASGQDVETPTPITREEIFLSKISGGGSSVNVIPLSVTENGTYTAPSGTAYSPIDVNVASGGGESGENKLAQRVDGRLTEVTAKDLEGATQIVEHAFAHYAPLTSITIPNSVTSIGRYAFGQCANLPSITIPNSVTSIGDFAFQSCSNLTSINFAENSNLTRIGPSAFYECSSLTSITIPNSVTSIGNQSFHKCSSLTSITIPNSVTSIEMYLFRYCTNLTNVTIGSGVSGIGTASFGGCTSLKKVRIEGKTAPKLSNVNAFTDVPTDCIFEVYNLDSYNSTNWVAIRDQYTFVEIED